MSKFQQEAPKISQGPSVSAGRFYYKEYLYKISSFLYFIPAVIFLGDFILAFTPENIRSMGLAIIGLPLVAGWLLLLAVITASIGIGLFRSHIWAYLTALIVSTLVGMAWGADGWMLMSLFDYISFFHFLLSLCLIWDYTNTELNVNQYRILKLLIAIAFSIIILLPWSLIYLTQLIGGEFGLWPFLLFLFYLDIVTARLIIKLFKAKNISALPRP